MQISGKNLNSGYKKDKKRPGRGISAGGGKTAGRGTKGQKSRAGHNIPRQFEGGQSNLSLRLPKVRGFKGRDRKIVEISLDKLDKKFKNNDVVSTESLIKSGLIKKGQTAKILANGELSKVLKIEGISISKSALNKIESAKPIKTEKAETKAAKKESELETLSKESESKSTK